MFASAIPGAIGSKLIRGVLLAVVGAAISSASAQNQTSQAVDRAQLLRTQAGVPDEPSVTASGADEVYASSSPNDPDLGEQAILKRQDSYQPFTMAASMPSFYTSNVALSSANEHGDAVFAPAIGFSYVPRIKPNLYASFSVGQQEFFYNEFSDLDFGSFDARAGLTYIVSQWHNLSLHAEYAYNRLTTSTNLNEFFSSHGLGLNAEVPFRFGRAQQASVGMDGFINIVSEPSEPGRNEFGAYFGYSVNLTRALTLSAVGRIAVRDYSDDDRVDVGEALSVSATYSLNRWWTLSATATLAHNDSNEEGFDYNVANIGGAISFAHHF
jgi:Putative beta-barrel porin 2